MPDLRSSPHDVRSVLGLARRDRAAAGKALAELDLAAQVALVCSAPAGRRAELLDLAPQPEALIPLLPEAELCFTVKAVGLESATWLLEHATQEQVVACLDLDAWRGADPEPARLEAWLEALSETSDDALHRALQALDPELLVLYLQSRVAVFQKPDDAPEWQPPAGTRTLEGQFHFRPLREGDDTAAVLRMLQLLFQREYWIYFRLMQGVTWELPSDNQEWALRWRTGRLEDLGFPRHDEAMVLYRYLRPAERAALPEGHAALDVSAWHLPVWIPSLPGGADSQHLLFRTLSAMTDEERRAAFFAFVAVANAVAVADGMDLSDAETTPKAIEKAARWISRGLEHVARENSLAAEAVLRRVPMEHLFRVGANLEPEAARK
jgi:hypothetical protein